MIFLIEFQRRKKRIFAVTFLFLSLIFLAACCKCLRPPVKEPEAPQGSIWIPLTGVGVPGPCKMERIHSSSQKLQVDFRVDGYEQRFVIEEGESFQKIDIPNAGEMTEVGKPNLPVIRKLAAVPPGKSVKASVVTGGKVIRRDYRIYPVQEPVVEQGPYRTKFSINRDFYRMDKLYPADIVVVSKPMIMRGQEVVQVEIFPMQYNPANKTLIAYTDIALKIEFLDTSKDRSGAPVDREKKLATPIGYWKQYKTFLNFDWLKDHLFFMGSNYLIITADEFFEEINPLALWKRTKGLSTRVVKFSAIGTSADDLRDYISNAYQNWTVPPDYVLLVGDVELIPTHIYNDSCASDLYYAAIDGSDFLPDLAVGRFSAKTEAEVTGMVSKTIAYEKEPMTSPSDWYTHISLVSDEGYFEDTSDWVYDFMTDRGYEADKFYYSLGTATTANITDAANEGRVIFNYRGHGGITGWSTGNFRNSDVLALENDRMLPVVISPTCQTGHFDDPTSDCFGEAWLKAGGAAGESGGVAFWGSSRNSYGGYNDELCKGVYKAAFNDGLDAFGDITNKAKLYMYDVYGTSGTCQLEFNLFNVLGDPELNVWFQVPTTLADGWKAIDLDILGARHVGGITTDVMLDVGSQHAFPVVVFPYSGSPACLTSFSVPGDWDGLTDLIVEFIWYSPTQDGNIKWSIVYDRKDVSKTPFNGFNRHLKHSWGARKDRVAHSAIELWALTQHGALNPGDIITLSLERFSFNTTEEGVENAITNNVHLIAARVLYKTN